MYNVLGDIESQIALTHGCARQTFRDFYGPFWSGSPSFWRRQGLLGLDPKTRLIDNNWAIRVFNSSKSGHTLNKQAALLTLYGQVRALKKYTRNHRVFWEEEVYDYIQKRTFMQSPKYMFTVDGKLRKSFAKNTLGAIENVTIRRLKQCLYDLYRTKNEKSGKTPRPEERARLQKQRTAYIGAEEACEFADNFIRSRGNPWDALR